MSHKSAHQRLVWVVRSSRWAVLAVLCASLLLVAMDATILNVALPSLVDDLAPDAIEQLWIIDIYGLILGGLLLTSGAAGDRWGRKRLFLIGIALFGVASIVAATSQSTEQLIAGRVLLAVGGAAIMPSTLSLLRNVFTDPRERTIAIGVWASVAGAGAAIGPVLGGFLVEHYGWAAAFWVNVPVVLAALLAGWLILPESRDPGEHGIDWFDALLSIAGMIVGVWGVKHLSPLAILAGAAILWLFIWRQKRLTDPMLDITLFRNRRFVAAAIAILTAMMAIGAALFLLTLWLQYVQGFSPFQAGIRMVPAAAALLIGALSAAPLIRRFGQRLVLGLGLGALALAFAALAVFPMNYPIVAVALVAFGIGDGIAVTAATTIMISAAPPERAGMAAALEETAYELGVGLGVALLGTLAANWYAWRVDAEFGHPVLTEATRNAFVEAVTVTSAVSAVIVALATLFTVRQARPA